MNLNLYEDVNVDRNKTWIDPVYKKLYSKEIPYYSVYTILKRFNPTEKRNDFFLVLTNKPDDVHSWYGVTQTRNGIIKINLNTIWNSLPIKDRKSIIGINIECKDSDEDGIIYYLDI